MEVVKSKQGASYRISKLKQNKIIGNVLGKVFGRILAEKIQVEIINNNNFLDEAEGNFMPGEFIERVSLWVFFSGHFTKYVCEKECALHVLPVCWFRKIIW